MLHACSDFTLPCGQKHPLLFSILIIDDLINFSNSSDHGKKDWLDDIDSSENGQRKIEEGIQWSYWTRPLVNNVSKDLLFDKLKVHGAAEHT